MRTAGCRPTSRSVTPTHCARSTPRTAGWCPSPSAAATGRTASASRSAWIRPRSRCARGGLHMRRLRILDRRGTARPVPGLRPPHGRGHSDGGHCIEGDNGVRANAAQIVAWWCAEDDATELATACAASAPGTRRYFDRDVMLGLYPAPQSQKNQKRRTKMGDIGKPRRRVIRVPATPIRKPVQEPSPAPKPAPEPVREPARTGYAHDEPGARSQGHHLG